MVSQDHLIEGSFESIGGGSLQYVTTLTNLVTIGIVIVDSGDKMFSICHVTACLKGYVKL